MSVSTTPTAAPTCSRRWPTRAIRRPSLRTARPDLPELAGVASHLADLVEAKPRVAVWAVPALETCAAVVGALAAGVPVVPINPKAGERELAHIVADCAPALLLTAPDRALHSLPTCHFSRSTCRRGAVSFRRNRRRRRRR